MSLTPEQELEMYADIKVIKNNCVVCRGQIEDHEKRLKKLENHFLRLSGALAVLSFILHYFLK